MRSVDCYFPGPGFPAVSLTGRRCDLRCPHCMAQPLHSMTPAETPEQLREVSISHAKNGAKGILLSGGCDSDGEIPIYGFLDEIRRIKSETGLRINAHIGFPRKQSTRSLIESSIDVFSITYPINDRIGWKYFGVKGCLSRFESAFEDLRGSGAKVVPHVLIGLGSFDEDIAGIRALSEKAPGSIVVIVFTPLRGTPLAEAPPVKDKRIIDTLTYARNEIGAGKIVLGCMRPKGRGGVETVAMEKLVDGIVMPSGAAERAVAGKVKLNKLEGCCAVYL